MGEGLGVRLLKQYWGYDTFRGIQEDIINSITEGRDTLGLMPTGGGKSITFQVPALAKEGLCLVITPLIALMKDQVQNLKKRGIKSETIDMIRYCGVDFNSWLGGFDDPVKSVRGTVRSIENHPLIPKDVRVHGFIIDSLTGELTRVE